MLTAHMIVKNEDKFVWYAISGVLPYVDKFIIYDTGSTDDTIKIIRSFTSDKINFQQFHINNINDIAKLRDMQIKETESGWFWIVDGDEVYPDSLCKEITNIVKNEGDKLEGIVVGRHDLLGDIYHYQDESVGAYDMFGETGHMALRLINKKNIAGLHVSGKYPYEEYFDKDNIDLIFHRKDKFRFTKSKLFHAMYLERSSQGANLAKTFHRRKYKIEKGHKFPEDFKYPEIFFSNKPSIVPDVTARRSQMYNLLASLITPIKSLKRKILCPVEKFRTKKYETQTY